VTALADLQTRIAFEIDRTDLTSAVAAAVTTAIKAHKFTRLPFNESSGTLTTAAGVGTYSTATAPPNALPSDILELDSARITTSASNRYLLEAVSWQTIDAIDNSGTHTSRPIWYAWHAEALRLYPAADGVYTIDLRYLGIAGRGADPVPGEEGNLPARPARQRHGRGDGEDRGAGTGRAQARGATEASNRAHRPARLRQTWQTEPPPTCR
jgi:hypothetical protein